MSGDKIRSKSIVNNITIPDNQIDLEDKIRNGEIKRNLILAKVG